MLCAVVITASVTLCDSLITPITTSLTDCCIVSIDLASTPISSFISIVFRGVSFVKSPVEIVFKCSEASTMGVEISLAIKYPTPKLSNKNIAETIIIKLLMFCMPEKISALGAATAKDQSVPSTGAYPRNLISPLYSYSPDPVFPSIICLSNTARASSLGFCLTFSKSLSISITRSGLLWAIFVPFWLIMKAFPDSPNVILLVIWLKLLPSLKAAKTPTMTPSCLIGTA